MCYSFAYKLCVLQMAKVYEFMATSFYSPLFIAQKLKNSRAC
jgi:hypothetical protein